MAIFLDANVFIYADGRDHPQKGPSRAVLELVAKNQQFFSDAEVFQELLHRYVALRILPTKKAHLAAVMSLMDGRIEPMVVGDVGRASELAELYPRLSARDLVHVAVMQRLGAAHIVTADTAFDGVEGVERLDPARVEEWRGLVGSE